MRDPGASALLTDMYQLTMLQSYYEHGMQGIAAFELFFRTLPRECWGLSASTRCVPRRPLLPPD